MINFTKAFLPSSQPTTCPHCGARTNLLMDFSHTMDGTEIHRCLAEPCSYEFVVQCDRDTKNVEML